jgi:PmbA protein
MLGQIKVEELIKRVLQFSEAPETAVFVHIQNDYLTRFANNGIHQNANESNLNVYVQAVDGKRVGRANTGDISDDGLRQVTKQALTYARMSPEIPDFPGLPDPQSTTPVIAMDEETIEFTPKQRAEAIGTICKMAAEKELKAFGVYSTSVSEYGVGSSKGVMLYHPATYANVHTVINGPEGSSWAQRSSWKVEDIDTNVIGKEAVEKAVLAQKPRRVEAEKFTIVLDPYATSDIVRWLAFSGANGEAVHEGRSWMNDRIGEQIMSPLVNIEDDGLNSAGMPLPFDFEGMPRQQVKIVENGVIRDPVYDRLSAARANTESTGHALPPMAFFSGAAPIHLVMKAGKSSLDEMIASTERGLYITRVWYTRLVHPRECVVTGMTRDGVYLIENGKISYPVKNLRFTQSYIEAMANVQEVGKETRLLAGFGMFGANVPAIKIKDFNFTGVTA